MAITTTKYSFSKTIIETYAPDSSGVYGLYDQFHNVIYYGKSDVSVKDRLLSHFSGNEGRCTQSATYFNFESPAYPNPIKREEELLQEHRKIYGELPKCNDVS